MQIQLPQLSNDGDRGQVGIETLIVFIAMILVAAIAASVLINTAGYLQNQASATSEDSESQVSNQVLVISTIGEINPHVNATRNNITEINMTIMQSPGAGEIDLEGASVEYIGPDGEATLTYNGTTTSVGEFDVTGVRDEGGTAPVLTDRGDRFVLQIPLYQTNGDADLRALEAGEEATLRIVTQSGSQAVTVANVPESLSSYSGGDAVEL